MWIVIQIVHTIRIHLYVRCRNYDSRRLYIWIENTHSIVIRWAICFIELLKIEIRFCWNKIAGLLRKRDRVNHANTSASDVPWISVTKRNLFYSGKLNNKLKLADSYVHRVYYVVISQTVYLWRNIEISFCTFA